MFFLFNLMMVGQALNSMTPQTYNIFIDGLVMMPVFSGCGGWLKYISFALDSAGIK